MEIVAAIHGTGTFDHGQRKWKLRTKELTATASIRKLSELFRTEVPNNERESRTYWLKYLAELRKLKTISQADAELQAAKIKYKDHDPDPRFGQFERGPDGDIRRKLPLTGEEREFLILVDGINEAGNPVEFRDYLREQLRAKVKPEIPVAVSLKAEIKAAIDRAKARNPQGKGWFSIRQFLDKFGEAAGDISFKDITVKHYRTFWEQVKAEEWSDRNKANAMQCVNTFLKRLEADHDLRFSFRHNPEYRLRGGEGRKVQYSEAEVKTALDNATGIARTALLLGLNVGAYWGDITSLKAEDIEDGYLKKGRQKNQKKDSQVVGCWRLWPETVAALKYGATKWQLEEAYRELRAAHSLPEHKALRKTVAQWIQDEVGETEARLYRCEGVGGTHGKNYIRNFTPPQIAKLEAALKHVHDKLFSRV